MKYETITVSQKDNIMTVIFNRSTINSLFLTELNDCIDSMGNDISVVIFKSGCREFCTGADFSEISNESYEPGRSISPESLWEFYYKIAFGSFISVAYADGRVNAGGMGIIAACDVVISSAKSTYSLSEMLFGLIPACVFPFLIRKIGERHSNFLALTTKPVSAEQALEFGLIDQCAENAEPLLLRILSRLKIINKKTVVRYKKFLCQMSDINNYRGSAIETNRLVFSDEENIEKIRDYIKYGTFPW